MNQRPTRAPAPTHAETDVIDHHEDAQFQEVRTNHAVATRSAPAPQHPISERVEAEQPALPTTPFANLAGAIAAVMAEIKPVDKEGWNDFQKYNYARMQDLSRELTPLMGKHGIVIFQTEEGRELFDDGKAVAVRYRFTVAHSSGEIWPERLLQTGLSSCRNSKGGFDDKTLNKCHTSARKYFLLSLFQIPTSDEDDADGGGGEQPQGRPRGQQRRQAPSPTGKVSPHFIAIVDGEAPETWAERFTKMVAKAETPAEINHWYDQNAAVFTKLQSKFPAIYDSLIDAMDKREAELTGAAKEPAKASATTQQAEPLAIPASLDRRTPPAEQKPEISDKDRDWLLALDGDFRDCSTIDELTEQQAAVMQPHKATVTPTVWNAAVDVLNKHIERVNG